jgi:hypothetical protein
MEKRFVVPAVSFIAGVLIWVAFYVVNLVGSWVQRLAPWLEVVSCLVVGSLILFSAVRCYKVGGPRIGSIVRAIVLLLMALLTIWKVGNIAASVLLGAAIVTGALALMGSYQSEADA